MGSKIKRAGGMQMSSLGEQTLTTWVAGRFISGLQSLITSSLSPFLIKTKLITMLGISGGQNAKKNQSPLRIHLVRGLNLTN